MATFSEKMAAADRAMAEDVAASHEERASAVARICVRAIGHGLVAVDDELRHAVDLAVRAAVVAHLSGR